LLRDSLDRAISAQQSEDPSLLAGQLAEKTRLEQLEQLASSGPFVGQDVRSKFMGPAQSGHGSVREPGFLGSWFTEDLAPKAAHDRPGPSSRVNRRGVLCVEQDELEASLVANFRGKQAIPEDAPRLLMCKFAVALEF